MNPIKYRLPNVPIYLTEEGLFSPKVEPGERVVNLTREHARILEITYPGQAFQGMTLWKGSSEGVDEFYEAVSDIFSIFTFGIDLFGYAKKLNDWITGAPEAPDPLFRSLQQIHEGLKLIQDVQLAAWVTSREENLASLRAHSATALQTANAFLQARASRTDPVWANSIAIALRDSLYAVNVFAGDIDRGYWRRPDSIAAMSGSGNPTDYWRGWMPHMPDRAEVDQFKTVWDHRWALPAFLYAVFCRVAVMRAFATTRGERRAYCAEIARYAKTLGHVFTRMMDGIRTHPTLTDLQRQKYGTMGHIPIVAADIHGGDYLGGAYFSSELRFNRFPPGLAPGDMIQDSVRIEDVEFNVRAFARHWWNLLAQRIGIPDLLTVISHLQSVCDKPWFPLLYIDVQQTIRDSRTVDGRKLASTAASLVTWAETGDAAGSTADLTFTLYRALETGGPHAQEVVSNCVRDLVQLRRGVESQSAARRRDTPAQRRKSR